ncbi:MAG TPA: DUF5715 family protein [Candidatus Angelobacter sp.]|nr:DUF5715 family protein [Candidatus Angelobacter sp.]
MPVLAGMLLSTSSIFAVQTTQPSKSHHKTSKSSSATAKSKHYSSHYAKWAPMFPGSHDKLVEQNVELDKSQVQRMNSEFELVQSESSNDLVQVNETEALKVSDDLMDTRRYCRPWTRDFLQDFSTAYFNVFHQPLQVNSLVRTADQQAWLRRHNRFAAPAWGDTASTHLAGVAVDLSRRGLSNTQYQWIRGYLAPLQQKGMVDPIEERQPVLHIVVFEKYSDKYLQPKSNSEAGEATELDLLGVAGSQP